MFRVGQKVARFKGEPPSDYYGPCPAVNEPCTVVNVYFDEDDEMIELAEYPSPAEGDFIPGWMAIHFRPILERKTDITVFTEILRKATKRKPATV